MHDDEAELKGAAEKLKNFEHDQKKVREELVSLLISKLDRYNLTELSVLTGIKRTTLYYMIWGKSGKRQQAA